MLTKSTKREASAAKRAQKAMERAATKAEKGEPCISCMKAKGWDKLTDAEKKILSEHVGETGMEKIAKQKGYEPVLKPSDSSGRPQGFDGVYRDKDGTLVIGEAKGGYNGVKPKDTLGTGYGHKQGSIGWARAAARKTKKASDRAINKLKKKAKNGEIDPVYAEEQIARIQKEKAVAEEVLSALKNGNPPVRVELFHTPHAGGTPGKTAWVEVSKTRK